MWIRYGTRQRDDRVGLGIPMVEFVTCPKHNSTVTRYQSSRVVHFRPQRVIQKATEQHLDLYLKGKYE